MPSSEEPQQAGSTRPARRAATMAALAIRNDAADITTDDAVDTTLKTIRKTKVVDRSEDAFAEIMSNRSKIKVTKPQRKSSSTATANQPLLDDTIINSDLGEDSIPDMEDLVAEAAKVRISGEHSPDYHRFLTAASRQRIHDGLLAWYDINHRKLPWRRDYHSPVKEEDKVPGQRAYEVWVSEIMCQQTQVGTVIPYFNTWMAKWPTIAALAAADIEEVNKVWTGLGYYSRASRLHTGAQKVLKEFNGVLPSDPVLLEKEVPGVGRYTAGAIVSHAYNVPAELVDGNVIRVLSRLRAIGGDVKSPKVIDLHWRVAKDLLNSDRPGCFNQALMEMGAVVCTPQNPKCGECPVQSSCRAYAEVIDLRRSRKEAIGASKKRETVDDTDQDADEKCELCLPETEIEGKEPGLVTQYPRKAVKKAPREEECAVSILERRTTSLETGETTSAFLLVKRPEKGLLAGMWEFPTVEQDQLQARHKNSSLSTYKQRSEASREYLIETLGMDWIKSCTDIQRRDLGNVQHLFSHIRKTYHVEWVLVQGQAADRETKLVDSPKSKQGSSVPETEWLSTEELATAAIPTGINKTFQLLQKFKEANESLTGGKRKGAGAASTASSDGLGRDKKKVKKEVKKENDGGQATLSSFFTRAK
ncbi:DNA glycosylase [Linnemannia elongata]|nr:DNA glycosylase [Linnemannia elongata]